MRGRSKYEIMWISGWASREWCELVGGYSDGFGMPDEPFPRCGQQLCAPGGKDESAWWRQHGREEPDGVVRFGSVVSTRWAHVPKTSRVCQSATPHFSYLSTSSFHTYILSKELAFSRVRAVVDRNFNPISICKGTWVRDARTYCICIMRSQILRVVGPLYHTWVLHVHMVIQYHTVYIVESQRWVSNP